MPSSTLIVAAKSNHIEENYNYRILLAKRSVSTAFAPDHYVFPGGVFDLKADESTDWLEYFASFGVKKEDLDKLCLCRLTNRPKPLMTNGVNFSRDISLRITAVREAFEEVGILFCINRNDFKNTKATRNFNHNFDRVLWQRKVHKNSMDFLNLCKFLDVVPDLWSLYEWSIWRSPPTALKKYDTVIYVVTIELEPDLTLEPNEIEKALWKTPSQALELFTNQLLWLAPMQFYEISRLRSSKEWSALQIFVKKRSSRGSTLIMLAYYKCEDSLVGVLPGDDYYPISTLNHTETMQLPFTDADFKAKTKNIHRITYYDMYTLSVTSNITPIDGHLSPLLPLSSSKL